MKFEHFDQQESSDEPNITPLIDIVFILLIFFVVTTTFTHELGLDVERPEASTGVSLPSHLVRVAISRDGRIAVDGQITSLWRVESEVRDRLASQEERSVLVIADAQVETSELVELIDASRRGGAEHVALSVEGEK